MDSVVASPSTDVNVKITKECRTLDNKEKIGISILSAIVAVLIFTSFMFNKTNMVFGSLFKTVDENERPTSAGMILHGVVLAVVFYLMMIYW